MEMNQLRHREDLGEDTKVSKAYAQLEKLLALLSGRDLPKQVVLAINSDIDELNAMSDNGKAFRKQLKKKQDHIVRTLEKETRLVPKNYYQGTWMAIGMAAFGLPLGFIFGFALDNLAFMGIGLPIGLSFGLAIGAGMDKKAFDEGRQLDFEIA
jgi:hypothetical protein